MPLSVLGIKHLYNFEKSSTLTGRSLRTLDLISMYKVPLNRRDPLLLFDNHYSLVVTMLLSNASNVLCLQVLIAYFTMAIGLHTDADILPILNIMGVYKEISVGTIST